MADITSTPEPEPEEEEPAAKKPYQSLGEFMADMTFQVRSPGPSAPDVYQILSPFSQPPKVTPPPYMRPAEGAEDKPAEQMYGMQLLKDMSKADMIEELLHHYRLQCQELNTAGLIHNIVHARLQTYSKRLHREARECGGNFSGFSILGDNE